MSNKTAIVIGAGIVGLATALALSKKGYKVQVFERNPQAVGASIRNFGMIWPIGQANGKMYDRAMRSKAIWKQICNEAGIWYDEVGSLHLAYHHDELQVMAEYVDLNHNIRPCKLLSASQTLQQSEAVNPTGLKGALCSADEMIVEARTAINQVAKYLEQKFKVDFFWNTAINNVIYPAVYAGKNKYLADEIYICSGADFETLYPEVFLNTPITKCKLQMMRLNAQAQNWRMGASLCGGLSMIHYAGFQAAPSLQKLKERYQTQFAEYLKWGIHVMVSQNEIGELTIGDSHEYGLSLDPFDKIYINNMIIDYLKTFSKFKNETISQTWNGIYPKMTNGETELVISPQNGVTIINALGGAGITLSFGLAEEIIG
jgi:FAD dependent oxidoreductase TIGR03364